MLNHRKRKFDKIMPAITQTQFDLNLQSNKKKFSFNSTVDSITSKIGSISQLAEEDDNLDGLAQLFVETNSLNNSNTVITKDLNVHLDHAHLVLTEPTYKSTLVVDAIVDLLLIISDPKVFMLTVILGAQIPQDLKSNVHETEMLPLQHTNKHQTDNQIGNFDSERCSHNTTIKFTKKFNSNELLYEAEGDVDLFINGSFVDIKITNSNVSLFFQTGVMKKEALTHNSNPESKNATSCIIN